MRITYYDITSLIFMLADGMIHPCFFGNNSSCKPDTSLMAYYSQSDTKTYYFAKVRFRSVTIMMRFLTQFE